MHFTGTQNSHEWGSSIIYNLYNREKKCGRERISGTENDYGFETKQQTLSFFIYCLALAFEHYRQVYIVHSGLQDESLQVTISKLP